MPLWLYLESSCSVVTFDCGLFSLFSCRFCSGASVLVLHNRLHRGDWSGITIQCLSTLLAHFNTSEAREMGCKTASIINPTIRPLGCSL